MAEFIFKKSDYTNADPEKDRRGAHKKGDLINHKPDGWAANWPNVGNYAEKFVCIRCPEITLAEAETADYRKSWREDFDYEVISTSQANVTLRVWNKNTSPTGKAAMTREKVENFLIRWGCTNVSFANRSVTFTFNLWNAVRSSEFWNIDLIANKVNFTLVSYNATTRVGRIQVDVPQENWLILPVYIELSDFFEMLSNSGQLWNPLEQTTYVIDGVSYYFETPVLGLPYKVYRMENEAEISERISRNVIRAIQEKGGTIISNNYPQIVFDIERNDIATRFRQDIKEKAEQVYKRHQYSISEAEVDSIIAAGGIVTMTRAELLSKLINHLES